jgi:uncharacterized caspase-like protein
MARWLSVWIGLLALLLVPNASLPQAQSGQRVALVIYVQDYAHQARLTNPSADARLVANALRRTGFVVDELADPGQVQLRTRLAGFAQKASRAEAAVIYFAGHGLASGGQSWLLPKDAKIDSESDVRFQGVDEAFFRAAVGGASRLRLLILDACRENAGLRPVPTAQGTRGSLATRGLSRPPEDAAELVFYAAADGQLALDGQPNPNSPFATALARNLVTPGLDLASMIARVTGETEDAARERNRIQSPRQYGRFPRDPFLFLPVVNVPVVKIPSVTPPTLDPTRYALVIANTAYDARIAAFTGPENDARLIAGALERAGFLPTNVKVVENLDQRGMKLEIQQFSRRLRASGAGSTAFFYFTGRGLQQPPGGNYLLPVREEIANVDELELFGINLDTDVIAPLGQSAKTLFVVIDASRDMPRTIQNNVRGLQNPSVVQNALIAFSASPGSVSLDSITGVESSNSPFARAVASALPRSGQNAASLFLDVRRTVAAETRNAQVPFVVDGLLTDFVFVPAASIPIPSPSPTAPDSAQLDALYWQGALAANTKAAFEGYLTRYPSGQFVSLARQNVDRITTNQQRLFPFTSVQCWRNGSPSTVFRMSSDARTWEEWNIATRQVDFRFSVTEESNEEIVLTDPERRLAIKITTLPSRRVLIKNESYPDWPSLCNWGPNPIPR